MDDKVHVKVMTQCFIPGCTAIAEGNKLMFFKMSFGDLRHWWKTTAWVAKYNTELPRDALICERHFEERFIDRSRKKPRLMVGTIPTLHLAALEVDSLDKLEYFCRLCAKKGFTPMHYRLEQLVGMDEVVRCCLGRFQTEVGLPPGVCDACAQMVKKFTQFVKQCEESQMQLLQFQLKQNAEERMEEKSEHSAEYSNNVEANKENTDSEQQRVNPIADDQSLTKPMKNGNSKKKRSSKCFEVEKPCPDCGKLFKTQGRYYYHIQSHSEEEYGCQICGKKFTRKNALRRHLELVHSGKHKCTHCKQIFSTRIQLNHHRTEQHKSHGRKSRLKKRNAQPNRTEQKATKQIKLDCPVE